ncbi:hypothetical protein NSE_0008 [Neorickettsia sennetsu str. Miyayama]|uniref:Uncharacterized protein n=2 Tax=Ehrlichia sennetsu TaxID=951 RepID=Q2GF02_EHRS3|nr:hypothetical protein NSE_0008 [Neorickettsia sennetsu str. Miyayama]
MDSEMNISSLVALLLKKRSLWIIFISVLLVVFLEVLHITIGIDLTGDKLPDIHVLRTPSYLGVDLDGDKKPDYVLGDLVEPRKE